MADASAVIIEDDPQLRHIFERALTDARFHAEVIEDGQTALTRLTNITPDIIILDLHLPHVSGREILSYLRDDDRFNQTRIIVTSADPQMADLLRDKVDLVLIKPVSFVQLRDLAKRLLPTSTQ